MILTITYCSIFWKWWHLLKVDTSCPLNVWRWSQKGMQCSKNRHQHQVRRYKLGISWRANNMRDISSPRYRSSALSSLRLTSLQYSLSVHLYHVFIFSSLSISINFSLISLLYTFIFLWNSTCKLYVYYIFLILLLLHQVLLIRFWYVRPL